MLYNPSFGYFCFFVLFRSVALFGTSPRASSPRFAAVQCMLVHNLSRAQLYACVYAQARVMMWVLHPPVVSLCSPLTLSCTSPPPPSQPLYPLTAVDSCTPLPFFPFSRSPWAWSLPSHPSTTQSISPSRSWHQPSWQVTRWCSSHPLRARWRAFTCCSASTPRDSRRGCSA